MTFNNTPYVFWILPQQLVKHSFELENFKPKINKKDHLLKRNSCTILYCIFIALDILFQKDHTPEDLIEQLYHSALDTCLGIVSSSQMGWCHEAIWFISQGPDFSHIWKFAVT